MAAALGVVVAVPVTAAADQVIYDFTGTVTSAIGTDASAGTTISGTYTINLSAGNSAQNIGTVGSTSANWSVTSYGGSVYATPVPNSIVFSSTLKSGGVSFTGTQFSSSDYLDSTIAEGFTYGGSVPNAYQGNEYQASNANSYVQSYFLLVGGTGSSVPYDSNGLPVFGNATTSATGVFATEVNGAVVGELTYEITSLTLAAAPPVPLPSSLWLALSGLGGLAVMLRPARQAARRR